MEYIKSLEKIFYWLKQHYTLSGIEIPIANGEAGAKVINLLFGLRTSNEDGIIKVDLLGRRLRDYEKEVENFTDEVAGYLIKSPADTRRLQFETLFSKIQHFKEDIARVPQQKKFEEYSEFYMDTMNCMVKKGVLDRGFDPDIWYDHCLTKRKERLDFIVNLMEKKVANLQCHLTPVASNSTTKLQWKGQKNQLYHVLRQLKVDHELIGNSYNSLADFLISSVQGFDNATKETVEKELKRKVSVTKSKKVKIELATEE